MLEGIVAALLTAGISISNDQSTEAPPQMSSACGSGKPRDLVRVRVFPISIERRVFPSPDEIMAKGSSTDMVRAFWQQKMGPICDPSLPGVDESTYQFLPRIVVFVEGEQDREPILLEYPDWNDNPAPVRARVNGKMVAVPAAIVRRLLDYSRDGWRD